MDLDPLLLEILVCPDCKGTLTVDQDHDELLCDACGLAYPVRDNIPIMLVDEARRPAPAAAAAEPDAAQDDVPAAAPDDGTSADDAG